MNLSGLFSFISGSISSGVGALATWATAGFSTLFGNIVNVAGVLAKFIDWAKKAIGSIVGFLGALWDWLRNGPLKGVIDKLVEIFNKLRTWLKAVKKIIDQYRQMLNRNFQLYIKPLLDFIQRIRRVLFLFRLLGFKWAQRLDAKLQKIETDITAAFLGTLRNLNILADWINFIMDPFGLIQPNVLWGSITRSIGAIIASIQHAQLSNPPAYTATDQAADDAYFSMSARATRTHLRLTVGSLPEDFTEQQDLRILWAAEGF